MTTQHEDKKGLCAAAAATEGSRLGCKTTADGLYIPIFLIFSFIFFTLFIKSRNIYVIFYIHLLIILAVFLYHHFLQSVYPSIHTHTHTRISVT